MLVMVESIAKKAENRYANKVFACISTNFYKGKKDGLDKQTVLIICQISQCRIGMRLFEKI